MKRLTCIALVLTALALTGCSAGTVASASNEQMKSTAEAWLGLIDHNDFAESWNQSGFTFRTQTSEQKWEAAMKTAREPLGAVTSRKLTRVTFTRSLPGVPDGNYAVLQFQTVFANKPAAVETVTFTFEDGKWQADGYLIR